MTPFDDFTYFDKPTFEDLILLIGTIVAFFAFILWCCFPISNSKESNQRRISCRSSQGGSISPSQVHNNYSIGSQHNYTLRNDYTYHQGMS